MEQFYSFTPSARKFFGTRHRIWRNVFFGTHALRTLREHTYPADGATVSRYKCYQRGELSYIPRWHIGQEFVDENFKIKQQQ
ncbi:hypothetical protein [Phocaeicola sp.]|uniref:hypothetical protein n=1 Tax=Phocaeicola sp. TaxID=2773926 RepID=UPI003AB37E65